MQTGHRTNISYIVGAVVAVAVFGGLAWYALGETDHESAALMYAGAAFVGGIVLAAILVSIRNSRAAQKKINPWLYAAIGALVFGSVPFWDDALSDAAVVGLWGFLAGFSGTMLLLGGILGPRREAGARP